MDKWLGLLTVLQNFYSQKPKTSFSRSTMMERIFIFFQKLQIWANFSCGQEEFSSGVHAKKIKAKFTFFLCSEADKMEKLYIFWQRRFLQVFPGHKTKQFWQLCGNLSAKNQFFFLNVRKFSQKTYKSFRKTVSVKMFLWTLGMQFRHSCCYVFCCRQSFFLFKLQKKVKSVPTSADLLLLFFLGVFSGHENCIFGNAAGNKTLNSEIFSTQSSKMIEKNLLFQKKLLSLRMIHVTHGMQFWRPCRNFLRNSEFYLLKFGKREGNCKR